MQFKLIGVLSFALLQFNQPSLAVDKALLIGVDNYQAQMAALIGVGEDLAMMREVSQMLGYSDTQTRLLQGRQATLPAVRQAFAWLAESRPEDRILIYFSGHGARIRDQNQDESDGADEVLLLADSRLLENSQQLSQVLVDDEIAQLLNQLPARQVLMIIDACHSGSVNKSMPLFSRAVMSKTFVYPGMYQSTRPRAQEKGLFSLKKFAFPWDNAPRQVLFAAAFDDESALSTPSGSLFTRGIYHYVSHAYRNRLGLNLRILRNQVETYIRSTAEAERLGMYHTPQLHGDAQLMEVNFF